MAQDPRPPLSGNWLRLAVAAAALIIIAVVAYVGSMLLLGQSLSIASLLGRDSGGGPTGGVEAVSTEPVANQTHQVVATFTPPPQYTPTPAPSPNPTGTPTPAYPEALVLTETLNLRAGPGTVYGIVGQVLEGQRFRITGRNEAGNWLKICCPAGANRESWISADFAQSNLPALSLPVAQAPPTPSPTATIDAPNLDEVDLTLPAPGGFGSPGATNPLTGQPLDPARTGLRPVVVCINNDIAARPQFGISQADVMYEFLMEGFSLTRFSGVYYGTDSEEIGPVRSARLFNYYLGALYDAGLFCSGASDGVRYQLKNNNRLFPYLDLDLDDPESTRYARSVGNDYRTRLRTSEEMLRLWLSDWAVERPPSIQGFTFGGPAPGGASANSIRIPYPSVTASQVTYRYDAGSGRYLRSLGGAVHLDSNSGQQIAVENVIVQYMPHAPVNIVEDAYGNLSLLINPFGAGRAVIFRDGFAYEGTWRNDSSGEMPRFFAADGVEIPLKPGKSWISIVPLSYEIAYE